MAFKTHNKRVSDVGSSDSATRRLLDSAIRSMRKDREYLDKLPKFFTVRSAMTAWGYTYEGSANARIALLLESGAVEYWRYGAVGEVRGDGRGKAVITYRKAEA